MNPGSRALVVGQSEDHLCSERVAAAIGARIHADAVDAYREMRAQAGAAGFDLAILSGFRSFYRQLSIWNRKAGGELKVLDSNAVPLDITTLSSEQLMFAILRWSALPGASRHHWGTDIDVYDLAAKPEGYEVDLIPTEVEPGGMFAPLHEWLDAHMREFGFFRPYALDRRGVAPERWHLSYAPIADACLRALTRDVLRETVSAAEMALKDVVLANLDEIYERFVINIVPAA